MSGEEWRPVVDWEGRYEVSSEGRVRSLRYRFGIRPTPKILTPVLVSGYPRVHLRSASSSKSILIHHMMLSAFDGPRPLGCETRHLNGVRTDNRLCNLRWGTPKEQGRDRLAHGTQPRGSKHGCAKITENIAATIRRARTSGEPVSLLAMRYGLSESTVFRIVAGTLWATAEP